MDQCSWMPDLSLVSCEGIVVSVLVAVKYREAFVRNVVLPSLKRLYPAINQEIYGKTLCLLTSTAEFSSIQASCNSSYTYFCPPPSYSYSSNTAIVGHGFQ
jgi:hypothetical protein